MMKTTIIPATVLALAVGLSPAINAGSDPHDTLHDDHLDNHHAHEEQAALEQRLASLSRADVYSCKLFEFSNQCREYPISDDIRHKMTDLKQSCESMNGGVFSKSQCPVKERIARCTEIIRNHHDPQSLIYSNHYYPGKNEWTVKEVTRVCADLEGKLLEK